ncbi:MAG: hypothetical protein RL681_310 [Candidatus Parcubacteria bacterium]|jgi:hypothetical protein
METTDGRDDERDDARLEPLSERDTVGPPGLNVPNWQSYAEEDPGRGPFGII